ncbi:hypothetical protein [uncultured Veillonella sp.]|uniref:hypothetical protein n=1 Tax=uncultured Veillonella sp. TaxID=159268 RepID=UPI00262AED84|nr:hypothetical protein [uncultured Veillonella sp.]
MVALTPETIAAARKSLEECLEASVIPKEYWESIYYWLEHTDVERLYLVGRDAVGAWWASQEVKKLGYRINFAKSSCSPGNWFPEGDNWDMAKVNAKYKLVADWQTLIANEALEKIEETHEVSAETNVASLESNEVSE